jgi:hypothetical protein
MAFTQRPMASKSRSGGVEALHAASSNTDLRGGVIEMFPRLSPETKLAIEDKSSSRLPETRGYPTQSAGFGLPSARPPLEQRRKKQWWFKRRRYR